MNRGTKRQSKQKEEGSRPAADNHIALSYLDGPEDVLLHELLAEVLDIHLVINGERNACEPPCATSSSA